MDYYELCSKFGVNAKSIKSIDNGIINRTFLIIDQQSKKYILQEINNYVFKDVDGLMNNIEMVSNYINDNHNKDPQKTIQTLKIVKANELNYLKVVDENKTRFFRMYNFIENAKTYNYANEDLIFEAGVGFGKFQNQLKGFDAERLKETIPDFHNTPKRYKKLLEAENFAKEHFVDRFEKAKNEIESANQNKNFAYPLIDALNKRDIPFRVVHNDTKLNNVMFDALTGKAVAVIDLDTVMPGSLLYDYGDAIRYIANSAPEDERILDKINFEYNKFNAFTTGYLKEISNVATEKELELMPVAPLVMTYELAIRFLTDYLEGDKYFVHDPSRPDHNIERAKSQFKFLEILKSQNLRKK